METSKVRKAYVKLIMDIISIKVDNVYKKPINGINMIP